MSSSRSPLGEGRVTEAIAAARRIQSGPLFVPVHRGSMSALSKPQRPLFLELRRAPAHCGRHALGGSDLAETCAELGGGRVERADHVEPGKERGAESGGVCDAVNS